MHIHAWDMGPDLGRPGPRTRRTPHEAPISSNKLLASKRPTPEQTLSIYIYIYIYTSVNPCITCTKQSGAEQKLMPITDEQESALFERPFRTQATNAPHGCGLELHFSSMLRLN